MWKLRHPESSLLFFHYSDVSVVTNPHLLIFQWKVIFITRFGDMSYSLQYCLQERLFVSLRCFLVRGVASHLHYFITFQRFSCLTSEKSLWMNALCTRFSEWLGYYNICGSFTYCFERNFMTTCLMPVWSEMFVKCNLHNYNYIRPATMVDNRTIAQNMLSCWIQNQSNNHLAIPENISWLRPRSVCSIVAMHNTFNRGERGAFILTFIWDNANVLKLM